MHKSAPVLENNTHKLLWDFDIHTVHLISTRRPDLITINRKKRTWEIVDFAIQADHRIKLKENEKMNKYLQLARELKKDMELEGDDYTNHVWCFWYIHQRIIKGTEGVGGWWMSGEHPKYNIIENGHNTKNSPGELRRLAVTETAGKDHQLTRMWKKYGNFHMHLLASN